MTKSKETPNIDKDYLSTLEELKSKIKTAQIKAHLSVNKEMIVLYWQIGNVIIEKQNKFGWGNNIIDNISVDLKREFSHMKGFSPRNLRDMKMFAEEYPKLFTDNNDSVNWRQAVANLPWGHNIKLMSGVKDKTQRLWYAQQTIKNGWSRNVLLLQIQSKLYERQANKEIKTNNFPITLPEEQSDLASDIFKDEYNFEFIDNAQSRLAERAIEKALIDDIIKFLTELGKGFAFVGKQYHLEEGDKDFYIDLLFYHLELRSFIVIELKTTEFKPEYAGKMAFYLAQIDRKLKKDIDNNSIGIILCPKSNKQIQDDTINYITKPMGVAGYQLAESKKDIPKELEGIEELKDII